MPDQKSTRATIHERGRVLPPPKHLLPRSGHLRLPPAKQLLPRSGRPHSPLAGRLRLPQAKQLLPRSGRLRPPPRRPPPPFSSSATSSSSTARCPPPSTARRTPPSTVNRRRHPQNEDPSHRVHVASHMSRDPAMAAAARTDPLRAITRPAPSPPGRTSRSPYPPAGGRHLPSAGGRARRHPPLEIHAPRPYPQSAAAHSAEQSRPSRRRTARRNDDVRLRIYKLLYKKKNTNLGKLPLTNKLPTAGQHHHWQTRGLALANIPLAN